MEKEMINVKGKNQLTEKSEKDKMLKIMEKTLAE
jgi:hypothetical protein